MQTALSTFDLQTISDNSLDFRNGLRMTAVTDCRQEFGLNRYDRDLRRRGRAAVLDPRASKPVGETSGKSADPPRPWTVRRVLKVTAGLLVLGFATIIFIGMLNPNPAYDAAIEARDAVNRQLRDRGSAEYRDINVYRLKTGTLLVCGEVNARNGFGAMTGYARFIGPGGGVAIVESVTGDRATFDDLWGTWGCTGQKGERIGQDLTLLA